MFFYINCLVIITFLLACTVQDLKYRSVDTKTLITGAVFICMVAGMEIVFGCFSWIEALSGFIAGIVFLLIARISQEKLGLGDGMILSICGPLLGIENLLMMVLIALVLAAIIGGVIGLKKGRGLKNTVPFVPFLLAGFIFCVLLGGGPL